jgi:hypothetical protein
MSISICLSSGWNESEGRLFEGYGADYFVV